MSDIHSITEILHDIRNERFSVRRVFFQELDKRCVVAGGQYKAAWPDALILFSLGDWNDCYWTAIKYRDSQV